MGVEGDVVVVDVEGLGCGAPEAEAEGDICEAADEAGGLWAGFGVGRYDARGERRGGGGCWWSGRTRAGSGEGSGEDLDAVDPDGGGVGQVVELPLQQEPAVERDGRAGVVVLAERAGLGGVDVGKLEDAVRAGYLLVAIFGEAGCARGEKDDVAVGHSRDVHVSAAEEMVAQSFRQIGGHQEGVRAHGGLRRAEEQRVLAVGDLVRLDGERGAGGDVLGPEGWVERAGLEVLGEEGLGLGRGLLRGEAKRESKSEGEG